MRLLVVFGLCVRCLGPHGFPLCAVVWRPGFPIESRSFAKLCRPCSCTHGLQVVMFGGVAPLVEQASRQDMQAVHSCKARGALTSRLRAGCARLTHAVSCQSCNGFE